MNWRHIVLFLVGTCGVSGCATPEDEVNRAPVVSMQELPKHTPGKHIVRAGDSIYSIAWAYDLDYKDIAKANKIEFPYIIQAGDELKLRGTQPKRQVVKSEAKVQAKTKVASKKPNYANQGNAKSSWRWPVEGKLVQGFSDNAGNPHKGIDIVNDLGTPIYASESGKVVYSGQGLRGYGKLIIIKHNNDYLSAYAHNSKLYVDEGEQVSKGQKISAMGSSESEFVKLHFEIRKNGQPIDPLDTLPPMNKHS